MLSTIIQQQERISCRCCCLCIQSLSHFSGHTCYPINYSVFPFWTKGREEEEDLLLPFVLSARIACLSPRLWNLKAESCFR